LQPSRVSLGLERGSEADGADGPDDWWSSAPQVREFQLVRSLTGAGWARHYAETGKQWRAAHTDGNDRRTKPTAS